MTAFAIVPSNVSAATEEEIAQAISNGVAFLIGEQLSDGSWGPSMGWDVCPAYTGFVLTKLQDYAYELGYTSPFDSSYSYSSNVIDGWQYLLSRASTQTLSLQDHTSGASGTIDDPDTNGNGIGINWWDYIYHQGICLMALVASGTPDRPNDAGIDFNGDGNPDTYKEIAQDSVDWLAFAQADVGTYEGGFYYLALNNACYGCDNSNSGYAYLGLGSAESHIVRPGATPFACTVPDWVKTELNEWINYVQCPDSGGSGYSSPCYIVNQLKTGNLIFEMTFYGDEPGVTRFDDALSYIENNWQYASTSPGWGYNCNPASYQAMYCLMKGLEYSGIDLIDTDGDGFSDDDWFNQEPHASPAQDFTSVLVEQQNADGSWPQCVYSDSGLILSTTWALLTLEKIPELYPPLLVKNQCIYTGESFETFDLDDCIVGEVDHYGYSGNIDLTVAIDNENVVTITYPAGWTGIETITFTAYDEEDNKIDSDDAKFEVYPIPVADAGGPYMGYEGAPIMFDASGSDNPCKCTTLFYRWDFDNDGTWDTSYSLDPTATHIWGDDYSGEVVVEVSGCYTDTDTAPVTVNNIAPQTRILEGIGVADNYILVTNYGAQSYFIDILDDGSLGSPELIDSKTWSCCGAGIGDFDNDGDLDALVGDSYNTWYYEKIWYGNYFAPAVSIDSTYHDGRMDFAEADFNNDGNLDAIMAYLGDFPISYFTIYIGNGDGTFTVSTLSGPYYYIVGMDSADFNGDGNMDFIAASYYYGAYIYLGNGDGTFQSVIKMPIGYSWGVCAGDFDNDGDDDFIFGQYKWKFYPGNGDGTFGTPVSLGFPTYPDQALALAESDIDGDGNLDLVYTDDYNMYYRTGNGDGTFSPAPASSTYVASGLKGIATSLECEGLLPVNEGDMTSFTGRFFDPGWLDTHTATWDWGDGSPISSGTVTEENVKPFATGKVTGNHRYGDNGEYTITLTVTDDDGGVGVDTVTINVLNVPPVADAGADQTVDEGDIVDFDGSGTYDPGWLDELTYTWDFGDSSSPVSGVDLWNPTHVYGDNGVYTVTLTVEDDDGGTGTDTMTITVNNVDPTASAIEGVYFPAEVTLRVAGRKDNIVKLEIGQEDTVVGSVEVTRTTGAPNEATLYADIDLTKPYTTKLYYDSSATGNGANPVWFIIDGKMTKITEFVTDPQDPSTYQQSYEVDLPSLFTTSGKELKFEGTATDPGSDDLIFTWDFGDDTPTETNVHYNDGTVPDPYPSPWGIYPFIASDIEYHTYAAEGAYTVTLTVEDDDGGVTATTIVLNLS